MKKVLALMALVLATAVFLTACGDDSDTTATDASPDTTATTDGGESNDSGAGATTVQIEADPDGALAYTPSEASAKAGNVTIDFDNSQPVQHDVVVEDSSGEDVGGTDLIASESTSVTLQEMKAGDYTFYCSVPGHREGGMEGTLTVK
jgi:plastocyanin